MSQNNAEGAGEMTDQELNESLLKKIGFEKFQTAWVLRREGVTTLVPNIDLINDLSACFKWLVLELRKRGMTKMEFAYGDGEIAILIKSPDITTGYCSDTESKALCLAVDKFLR